MDVIAYWIYASLQALLIVVLFEVKGDLKRAVSLGFFTIIAPAATAMIAYLAMGKLIDWLQQKEGTK